MLPVHELEKQPEVPLLQQWIDNPYRLWSVWEMYKASANQFLQIITTLELIRTDIEKMDACSLNEQDILDTLKFYRATLPRLENQCREIGAIASAGSVKHLRFKMASNLTWGEVKVLIEATEQAIEDEMGNFHALILNKTEAELFTDGETIIFGEKAMNVFYDAIDNMHDACRCFALGLFTACVFHCMGVIEVGLRKLCKKLQMSKKQINFDASNCTWGKMVEAIKTQIDAKGHQDALRKQAHPNTWHQDEPFFNGCVADIQAFQKAYRNPTMHFKSINRVDEDYAKKVLDSVGAFIKHMAEMWDEVP